MLPDTPCRKCKGLKMRGPEACEWCSGTGIDPFAGFEDSLAEISTLRSQHATETMTCACCGATCSVDAPGVFVTRNMSRANNGCIDYSGLCAKCYANPAWKARLKGPEYPVPCKCACANGGDGA